MTEHPEGLIEGSGVAGDAKAFPHRLIVDAKAFSHRLIVDQTVLGTYIHCECGALFEEQGLPALLVFLENHSRLPLTSSGVAAIVQQDQKFRRKIMHTPQKDPESPTRGPLVRFLVIAIIVVLIALGIVLYVRR